jgi:hypothetical protein
VSQVAWFCPGCGAPIAFRWSSSIQTTCEQCHAILIRTDVNLAKVGVVSDLPPDSSPIQIGTEGRFGNHSFTVAGRIIYDYPEGSWNEWHIVMNDGASAWLSDAQAEYALTFVNPGTELPKAAAVHVGASFTWNHVEYQAATITHAHYRGVQGELPFEYWDKSECTFIDLRSATAEFATLDYSDDAPQLYLGKIVDFEALQLTNLRDLALESSMPGMSGQPKPGVQSMLCPNCGAPLTVRSGSRAVTVVCEFCSSLLDSTSSQLKLIERFKAAQKVDPLIPLGSRGKWRGVVYDVIGFQRRATQIEGCTYYWREYVLFNPYKGFRYFTEFDGHWNDATAVSGMPQTGNRQAKYLGKTYRYFQECIGKTDFVLGEFPWRVTMGDSCDVIDYIAPPFVLSSETSNQETTWTLSEYVRGAEIWRAFNLEGAPPETHGVFENQPDSAGGTASSIWLWFMGMAAIWLVMLIWNMSTARRDQVFSHDYSFQPAATAEPGFEASFVTPSFRLTGRTSAVRVNTQADLSNQWIYLNYTLINQDTGQAYDFGREVSYYYGVDSDGSWTEGSGSDSVTLPSIPSGNYYLRVEPESDASFKPIHYAVTVIRDVPTGGPYAAVFFLLLLPALALGYHAFHFEQQRWAESTPPLHRNRRNV